MGLNEGFQTVLFDLIVHKSKFFQEWKSDTFEKSI